MARRADSGDSSALGALDAYRDRLARALASVVNVLVARVVDFDGMF